MTWKEWWNSDARDSGLSYPEWLEKKIAPVDPLKEKFTGFFEDFYENVTDKREVEDYYTKFKEIFAEELKPKTAGLDEAIEIFGKKGTSMWDSVYIEDQLKDIKERLEREA